MITLTIKGISKAAHRELKKRAATHGRSLNTEAIAVLEASVRSTPVDAKALLQRMRAMRPKPASPAAGALERFKREGRA